MEDVQKTSDEIKKEIQKLRNESLELIFKDHQKALEYVKKGMEAVGSKELTELEINGLAHEMQAIAQMIIKERADK